MTEEEQKVVFVTNDSMLRGNGKLDPQDEAVLREAAKGGKVVVMSLEEALEVMMKEEPGKFAEFMKAQEKQAGGSLTVAQIAELAAKADERKRTYDLAFGRWLKKAQAEQIRGWRVNERYSWRAVARAAFEKVNCGEWPGWRLWSPPSNQIAGMSLCEVAARLLDGDYRREPWN